MFVSKKYIQETEEELGVDYQTIVKILAYVEEEEEKD